MSRARAPGAAREQAHQVAVHLLGSGHLRVIVAVVALLVGIGWLADSLFEWLTDLDSLWQGKPVENWWPLHRLVAVGFVTLEVLLLWWLARGARQRYRPTVNLDSQPAQAKGLVLFLSTLKTGEPEAITQALPELTGVDAFRTRFGKTNWRMPLEAIAYHRPRLRRVVVICSRESIAQWPGFVALTRQLFPGADFDLRELGALYPQTAQYQGGFAFDDVATVADATDDALANLLAGGLPLADCLIDVTGGLKLNAVAATAVALAEGRRIQYVSGQDPAPYKVAVYDVTYSERPQPD